MRFAHELIKLPRCVPKTKAAPNSQLERLSFYFNINMGTGSTSE